VAGALFTALCDSLAALDAAAPAVLEAARLGESAARLHARALAPVVCAAPGALLAQPGGGLLAELERRRAGFSGGQQPHQQQRLLYYAVLASAGGALGESEAPGVCAALGGAWHGGGGAAQTAGQRLQQLVAELRTALACSGQDFGV
jgi:hypothetical protein